MIHTTKEQINKIKSFIKQFNDKLGYEYIKSHKIKTEHGGDTLYFLVKLDRARYKYFSLISNVFSLNLLEQALQKMEI